MTGPLRQFRALRLLLPLVAIGAALLLFLGVGLIISFGGLGGRGAVSSCGTPFGAVADDSITPRVTNAGQLTDEQRQNAAVIIGVAKGMNLPPKAWVIALATAMQESGLRNLGYGDRDSLGLFQQRPSSGWGSGDQVVDPTYATKKFLAALQQVPNWPALPLTKAAQAVQRSAFPNAYAQWEPMAKKLVTAMLHRPAAKAGSCSR